jgi:hypothetical protein
MVSQGKVEGKRGSGWSLVGMDDHGICSVSHASSEVHPRGWGCSSVVECLSSMHKA